MNKIDPFVKWVGGKRQFLPILELMIPEKINTYIEPFVGGGALLFNLQPKKAIINDINHELMQTYISLGAREREREREREMKKYWKDLKKIWISKLSGILFKN